MPDAPPAPPPDPAAGPPASPPAGPHPSRRERLALRLLRAASRAAVLAAVLGALWLWATGPRSPLPPQWNPGAPFDLAAPETPVTAMKLRRALADPQLCRAALATGARFRPLPDLEAGPACHIRARIVLAQVAGIDLAPVETRCDLALRLALWAGDLRPLAREILGADLARIVHVSSYNCRPIRSPSGASRAMSLHATAEAIDIVGVRLADGRSLSLASDWNGTGPAARFLRAARDAACRRFATTLGPQFNALHADHFHLQSRGRGLCS